MIKADALVLLTDVDGLYTAPPDHPGSELIERVASADDLMSVLVTGAGSRVGTGGMATKVQAAMLATASGIGVQLASANDLGSVLEGRRVGTWFEPSAQRPASRRLWIAHVAPSRGEIIVDEGAAKAIDGRQEVSAGCWRALGARSFRGRGVVDVASPTGLIARGVSGYDSGHTGPDRRRGYGTAGGGRIRASQAGNSPRRPGGVR